jgi:hypothetical protein
MKNVTTSQGLRLKPIPLLVTVLLGLVLTIGSAEAAALVLRLFHLPNFKQSILLFLFIQHGFQLLLALIAIAVLKFWLAPADYGLYWPRGKSYILPALLWGLGLAIAVNAGNSWLDSLLHVSQATSDITYTHRTVWGWATFEGLCVGPTEEIPFRALLVT